jgi:hypothetical protein
MTTLDIFLTIATIILFMLCVIGIWKYTDYIDDEERNV